MGSSRRTALFFNQTDGPFVNQTDGPFVLQTDGLSLSSRRMASRCHPEEAEGRREDLSFKNEY